MSHPTVNARITCYHLAIMDAKNNDRIWQGNPSNDRGRGPESPNMHYWKFPENWATRIASRQENIGDIRANDLNEILAMDPLIAALDLAEATILINQNKRINELQEKINEQQEKINEQQEQLDDQEKIIAALDLAKAALDLAEATILINQNKRINEQQEKMNEQQEKINEQQEQLDDQEKIIAALDLAKATTLINQNKRINEIQEQLDDKQKIIDELLTARTSIVNVPEEDLIIFKLQEHLDDKQKIIDELLTARSSIVNVPEDLVIFEESIADIILLETIKFNTSWNNDDKNNAAIAAEARIKTSKQRGTTSNPKKYRQVGIESYTNDKCK